MKKRLKINGIIMGCAGILIVLFPGVFMRSYSATHWEGWIKLLGFALIFLGQIIRVSARGYKAENSRESQALIQGGPYQLVRNPMYLGIFLIGLGVVLAVFQWWAAIIFVTVFIIRYLLLIYEEEKKLSAIFPGNYQEYCKKVPRIFPALSSLIKLDVGDYLPIKIIWFQKEIGSIAPLLLLTLLVSSWEIIVGRGLSGCLRQLLGLFLIFGLFVILVILLSRRTKKMPTAQIKAKIISNARFSGNCWHLEFESRVIAKNARPGQFVNIKVNDGLEPLLRRPVSIHRVKGAKVKLFYEVLGAGTRTLSQRKPGEFLDLIGPLGNGFQFPSSVLRPPSSVVLVAGGMGVAPLVFLAEKIKLSKPLVLIGARTKKQILCAPEFKALGCSVRLATEDGSAGFRGKVTDLLKIVLAQTKPSGLFSCGPRPMLKAVSEIARENKINAQLSLEEHMACGIGACLGCVVTTESGYRRVCKDGPVFSSQELTW